MGKQLQELSSEHKLKAILSVPLDFGRILRRAKRHPYGMPSGQSKKGISFHFFLPLGLCTLSSERICPLGIPQDDAFTKKKIGCLLSKLYIANFNDKITVYSRLRLGKLIYHPRIHASLIFQQSLKALSETGNRFVGNHRLSIFEASDIIDCNKALLGALMR
jgi:hypothetical protein